MIPTMTRAITTPPSFDVPFFESLRDSRDCRGSLSTTLKPSIPSGLYRRTLNDHSSDDGVRAFGRHERPLSWYTARVEALCS